MSPCLEAVLAELAKAGVRDPTVVRGSKHWQVRWTAPSGPIRMVSVSSTPSDWRSIENSRRDVRQVLRRDGMLETPQPKAPAAPPRPPTLEQRVARLERLIEGLTPGVVDNEP
jgi:hypothetical protein